MQNETSESKIKLDDAFYSEIFKKIEQDREAHANVAKANKEIILTALKNVAATNVTCSYSGSGDSGQVDEVYVKSGDQEIGVKNIKIKTFVNKSSFDHEKGKWSNECVLQETSLEEAIRDLTYDGLEANFGGWENNDGASGMLVMDVTTGDCKLEHNSYYTQSDYSEAEI